MSKTANEREFDRRLIERRLRLGKANPKNYQDYLKSLPDSADNVQYVEVFEDKETTLAEAFDAQDGLTFTAAIEP